jgi:hypothetical protein
MSFQLFRYCLRLSLWGSIISLLLFTSSCAKEIYTDEDAANAKREAQKVALTVMICDVGNRVTDLSGFTVSSPQYDGLIQEVTSVDGIAGLMVVKGDVVLHVKKEGYVPATAVITTCETDKDRNNTVVIIPVFQASGALRGIVSVKTSTSEEPLIGALVSIDVDMNELMHLPFPGLGDAGKYLPGALTYSSVNLMQPVRTDDSGAFQFTIPSTVADLTYTVKVHETALTTNTFCSAKQTVVTNGQNAPVLYFKLSPYEK